MGMKQAKKRINTKYAGQKTKLDPEKVKKSIALDIIRESLKEAIK